MKPIGELVTVGSYTDPVQAHLACGRLAAEGIRASVAHEHHVWANWMLSQALGGVKVQVAAHVAEHARDVLARLEQGEYALETQEAEQAACPRCGSSAIQESKLSWRLAFLGLFLCQVPLPFARGRYHCLDCRHRWQEQDAPAEQTPGA